MREIKFRAWQEGYWAPPAGPRMVGVISMTMGNFDNGIPKLGLIVQDDSFGQYELSVSPDRVMQFTGLHDKNNKEIYEGDWVTISHPHKQREWTGLIIWDKYRFAGRGFSFSHFDYPDDLFSEGTEYIEVIGNIHENPELLK